MGKTKENPRYNVLSMRVSDQEKEELEKAAKERDMSPGTLGRILIFGEDGAVRC